MRNEQNMKKIISLFVIFTTITVHQLFAQNQDTSYNYFEPGYQVTQILGSAASFIEVEAGRQLPEGLSYGIVVHFLISNINKTSGNLSQSINSLWYAGPRFQYSKYMKPKLSLYGGSVVGLGFTDYVEAEFGTSIEGGFLIGIRPELGIRYEVSDLIRLNIGTNFFYGYIASRDNIFGAPSLRIGFRLGR